MIPRDAPDFFPLAGDRFEPAGSALWEPLCEMVRRETGMNFAGIRENRLRETVRKVLAKSGIENETLRTSLADPERRARLLERISGELTVGESYFFRNEYHFQVLREIVLPDILRANASRRQIRIWSAGCATGEEPYSLAILLDQILGDRLPLWKVSILATDLNPDFLMRAKEALYRVWSFRRTEIHRDPRYFRAEGERFRLAPRLRSMVHFARLNLAKDVYPSPLTDTVGLDLILFRNVAIYLRPEVTGAILARFRRALRPGGRLLLGESEVTLADAEDFQTERFPHATFHRRGGAEGSPAAAFPLPSLDNLPATYEKGSAVPGVAAASSAVELSIFSGPPQPVSNRPQRSPMPARVDPPRRSAAELGIAFPQRTGPAASGTMSTESIDGSAAEDPERMIARLSDRPSRARARLAYSKTLLEAARTEKAREMLAVCLREEPLLLEAHLLAAALAEEAGDCEAAEQAYRRAVYIDPKCVMSRFHLGMILHRRGKRELAEKNLTMAMALTADAHPDEAVEHGEGVCCGRLRELIENVTGGTLNSTGHARP